MVLDRAALVLAHGTYPLPAGSHAVVPSPARVDGGRGLAVVTRSHRGLLQVGGPVEATGRLRYIDGCSDTVLASPVVRGDPCLNLLHLPAGTVQSHHRHPSLRVGLVVSGSGTCVHGRGHRRPLRRGSVFVLAPGAAHHFETGADDELLVMAWHPDSESGPTHDDHPMLNRTLRVDSTERVR